MRYREARVVPFDVPGHKHGKGNPDLTAFLGERCMAVDVNSMKPLDNLCHPVSVIKDAEALAAQAFGAANCFFMVGGTTAAVQSMVMSVCKEGDKIIMPRNVHRSAINALVISGAVPVYIDPGINDRLGIPLGSDTAEVEKAIKANPDAKAVFVNNPTYYGICSDIKKIAAIAHENKMACLADEAHGTHFYFGEACPISAMEAGADLAAVSMHKSGGSLTQSSLLLLSENAVSSGLLSEGYVRAVINLTQTTSASYLLLSSLDISRRNLALNGAALVRKVSETAEYARGEIAKIGGYYAFSAEILNGRNAYAFDKTKLSVHTRDIGLAGIEVYDLLRDRFDIQIEFGDIGNILAYISVGDKWKDIERLVSALAEIKRRFSKDKAGLLHYEYINPKIIMSPKEAFYGERRAVDIRESVGRVSGEFVMCYPPGIPILAPGELITKEILEYILYSKEKGCSLTGTEDMGIERIKVISE
ncbi:MAG: aminotransferase class I/II-fold pyridoxal phosphate-dependent enzyme [Oscillospiraceae bacterium]|nr:aminotransferase class I/II-fold pyridoxal phosphate-dependent enzyme [Oscillospiraceae bacterium]